MIVFFKNGFWSLSDFSFLFLLDSYRILLNSCGKENLQVFFYEGFFIPEMLSIFTIKKTTKKTTAFFQN